MEKMNRRTVLQGAGGVALGLPFLEAMGAGSFSGKPPVRLAYIFLPNGVGPDSIWNPKKTGKAYDLSSSLQSLAPVKELVNVHTGLKGVTHVGTHHMSTSAVLTCTKPNHRSILDHNVSIDQLAAQKIGQNSFIPSLELSLDKAASGIDSAMINTSYGSHISWSSAKTPVPREIDPHSAFKRLFNDSKGSMGGDLSKSILDNVKESASRLNRVLGREDKQKIDQYFYSIRQIERRLAKIDKKNAKPPLGTKAPKKNLTDIRDRAKAMIDIMVLAFQTDRTKVASLMLANDSSMRIYDFLPGVNKRHHQISHYASDKSLVKMLIEVNKYHVGLFAGMVQKMSTISEGSGTLLDNSLILFTSNLKDGNKHTKTDLPVLLAGRGGGKVKTGLHEAHKEKNFSSLLLGMAKTAGCKGLNSFAGSSDALI
ncbi:MAG: DUF1552 domain-containing protein [Lentisphaeraceae bacterium]|nr:DUF1552 domain-containing protein [Lentisphaeraceae bacterium]